jgi:hypothetical protein
MKRPPLTPYGVYLLARLCRLTGKPLPMRRIEGTSEHMFAAVLGTEDGVRASLNPNSMIPVETAFMSAMRMALTTLVPHAASHAVRAIEKSAQPKRSLVDDMLEESEERRT